MKYILGLITTMFLLTGSYTIGHKVALADNKPVSDFVEFSDYQANYRFNADCTYLAEVLREDGCDVWYIYVYTDYGMEVITYEDTLINGQITSAAHWKDSFIANFKGLK